MPIATIFYADILGFSRLSQVDVGQAAEALEDLTTLFSTEDELARYVQRDAPWSRRFALSDSMLLIADETESAVLAAGAMFFSATYLNASVPEKIFMMRGSIVRGDWHELNGLFPETAARNAVGPGVAEAVMLEKSGAKGPRLIVSAPVRDSIESSGIRRLLSSDGGHDELLWPLAQRGGDPDLSMLRPLFDGAWERTRVGWDDAAIHYAGFAGLLLRSIERLRSWDAAAASALSSRIPAGVRDRLRSETADVQAAAGADAMRILQ